MRTLFLALLLLVLSLPGSVSPISAQSRQESFSPSRHSAGGQFLVGSPRGEFAENVGTAWGVGGWFRFGFDEGGTAALRIDADFLNYGNESQRICIVQPCRIQGELTTSNNLVAMGVGPELSLGSESVRLYLHGGAGFSYFVTTSSVEGTGNQGDPFAQSTNHDDVAFAWTAGGGTRFRFTQGRNPISLDLGVRYHGVGNATYLTPGDIEDLPGGGIVTHPRTGEANLVTFRIGIDVAVGGGAASPR